MTKKIYRSMQGVPVDMEALRTRNEMTLAVGNKLMNARGDELGPGGKVIKKRNEVVAEYYDTNPNAIPKQNPVAPPVSKIKPSATNKPEGKKK
jgi:hypothetical protein